MIHTKCSPNSTKFVTPFPVAPKKKNHLCEREILGLGGHKSLRHQDLADRTVAADLDRPNRRQAAPHRKKQTVLTDKHVGAVKMQT